MQAFAKSCPLAEWEAIVSQAVSEAKAGDAVARAWLGRYILGDPGKLVLKLSDLAEKEQRQALTADAQGGKSVLAELLMSEDPRIRLGAARVLLDLQAGSEGVAAFLRAVDEAVEATGPYEGYEPTNAWRPEGED